jgi:3-methyladenine DNA glycosylase/8-oxoguanine DNA glycosylase
LLGLALAHRFEVTVKKLIEPAFGDLQFSGGLRGRAEAVAELLQDVANERSAEALEELRYFFSW